MPSTRDSELHDALDQVRQALVAMRSGDPEPHIALWPDTADIALFGAWGPIEHGYQHLTDTVRWLGGCFTGGTLEVENAVVHAGGQSGRGGRCDPGQRLTRYLVYEALTGRR
jgi:hypothetical protein